MNTQRLAKLFDAYANARRLEYNAMHRAMQYVGYETGRKAAARRDHYGNKADALEVQIRAALAGDPAA